MILITRISQNPNYPTQTNRVTRTPTPRDPGLANGGKSNATHEYKNQANKSGSSSPAVLLSALESLTCGSGSTILFVSIILYVGDSGAAACMVSAVWCG
jgi:hypothetical protein